MARVAAPTTQAAPARSGLAMSLVGAMSVIAVLVLATRIGSPYMILLAPAAAVAVLAAMARPTLGLAAIIAITTSNASDNLIVSFGAPSIAKLIVPAVGGLIAFRWIVFRDRPLIDAWGISLLALLALVQYFSATWALRHDIAVQESIDTIKEMIVAVMAVAFFRHRSALAAFVLPSMLALAAICAAGIAFYVLQMFEDEIYGFVRYMYVERRFSGPINDPNFFGAVIVLFLPTALDRVINGPGAPMRMIGMACFALLLGGLLLTQSRGGLLAAMAALGVYSFTMRRRSVLILGAALALAFVTLLPFISADIVERLEGMLRPQNLASGQDVAVEGRLASWAVAAKLFYENPLLGVGAGNFNVHYQAVALDLNLIFRGEGRSAHSLYLEILAETGLLGLGVMLAIVTRALFGTWSAMRIYAAGGDSRAAQRWAAFGAGVFGYLIAMIFLHDSYPRLFWSALAVAMAAPLAARRNLEDGAKKPRG
jgi:putative inorganic carbon (HCO3(-)) transporter